MNTKFLNEQDIAQVESIMDAYGISGFDACVRLWGRGKTIHVSGDVHKQELACLLAIARFLSDCKPDDGLAAPPPARMPGASIALAAAA